MKIQKIILSILSIIFLTACSTTSRVISDFEKKADFDSFRTYEYLNHFHNFPIGANPINQQRIEEAIELELADLGYKKSIDPDLLISWFVTIETVRNADFYYHNFYSRWDYIPYREKFEYQVGTLVIDIIDKANGKVVWHGTMADRVYEGMPKVEQKIKDAVDALFKKYAKDTKWKRRDYAVK